MRHRPVTLLNVTRTLSDGSTLSVGQLAQNRQGVFFQYDSAFLEKGHSLSPFLLPWNGQLHLAPKTPHEGLHGVFADALPDGWGRLLMDRYCRRQQILPQELTAMDRLAFIGDRGNGALSFTPTWPADKSEFSRISLQQLGEDARQVFDGQTDDVLNTLIAAGSSGGARPKAQVYFPSGHFDECHLTPQAHDNAWLVKFTSAHLPLGHEEGRCEAVWLTLARQAGLDTPNFTLLPGSQDAAWLAVKRFDRKPLENGSQGKLHLHSACGLLDADFRLPSLDYEDLIKAGSQLCQSPAVGQAIFRRALFNLLAINQDDHSNNWAFLQQENGTWSLAPFYDVTFSPHPFNEHTTSFAGYGHTPPKKAIERLADVAGFSRWQQVRDVINATLESLSNVADISKNKGVSRTTQQLIQSHLNDNWRANRHLLG